MIHGTPREAERLRIAAANHCACTYGLLGVRLSTCPAHLMAEADQRAMDGLLFVRRTLDRWRRDDDYAVWGKEAADATYPHPPQDRGGTSG